ncbi:S-layer homology domain-containing protein [Paenibacillus gansuensis]|uniref:S-layer homology domain-containing protein n=1 Tax=Paenibacillus gansuensis TaxID=306542 RepID=A0ABW5PC99_9BACL
MVIQRKAWQQLGVGVTLSAMLFSGSAYAAGAASQSSPAPVLSATPFQDVIKGHWAQKHIAKLSLLGIISGNNGRFNPAATVSRQDAVIMAVRLMGLDKELKQADSVNFPDTFQVSGYAKPYVAAAFDHGLLAKEEEMRPGLDKDWGKQTATRDWVAKIVIRSINKENVADSMKDAASVFKDGTSISKEYRGYVNAAAALKIVSGTSDQTYRPAGKVSRAEMATFLSRAESNLGTKNPKVFEAVLVDRTEQGISLADANGNVKSYTFSDKTLFFTYKDQTNPITSAALKLYTKVYVIGNGSAASYVETTDDAIQLEKTAGTFVKFNAKDKELVLNVDGDYKIYPYSETLKVVKADGSEVGIDALSADSQVEIGRDTFTKQPKVQLITLKKAPVNLQAQGTFVSADSASSTIQVKDAAGTAAVYPVSPTVSIRYGDAYFSKLSELQTGDTLSYEVKNGTVTSITVSKRQVTGASGTLTSVSADKKTVTIRKADGNLAAFEISSSYSVSIKGLPSAVLDDLESGDTVNLELKDDEQGRKQVTKFILTGREVQSFTRAKIYFNDAKFLIITDAAGKKYSYDVNERTKIIGDGQQLPLQLFAGMFTKDRFVNVIASGSRLVRIELAGQFDGTVQKVDTALSKITLVTPDNEVLTFGYSSPRVEDLSRSSAVFADVKAGDRVQLVLDSSQDKVSVIRMERVVMAEVLAKDTNLNKLQVKDESGSTTYLQITPSVTLFKEKKEAAALADFAAGQPVFITYWGNTVSSIRAAAFLRGSVVTMDTASNRLTVKDYANQTKSVDAGSKVKVTKNGTVSANLQSLSAGDRIYAYTENDGTFHAYVLSGERKTVWNPNEGNGIISFKRSSLTAPYQFQLRAGVYIHKGDQVLTLNDLKENDNVVVYLQDGKVVEIEK